MAALAGRIRGVRTGDSAGTGARRSGRTPGRTASDWAGPSTAGRPRRRRCGSCIAPASAKPRSPAGCRSVGWSLRRIQKTTGVRRETAAAYLREAGVAVRPPGLWGHRSAADCPRRHRSRCRATSRKTGHRGDHRLWRGVGHLPDSSEALRMPMGPPASARADRRGADPAHAKPAIEVTTDFGVAPAAEAAAAVSVGQRVCGASRRHRTGALPRPQRHGDLAGSGRHPRLRRRLSERQALRAQTARRPVQGSLRGDRDRGRAKRPRSITAPAPWSAIRTAASTAACGCSC